MIKMQLHNPKLQFIPFGKGKVHARWDGLSGYIHAIDRRFTMCGRPITDEMKPLDERAIDVQKLCQNCYSSLRTYGPQVELVKDEEVVK